MKLNNQIIKSDLKEEENEIQAEMIIKTCYSINSYKDTEKENNDSKK